MILKLDNAIKDSSQVLLSYSVCSISNAGTKESRDQQYPIDQLEGTTGTVCFVKEPDKM